jgi:hypothetical protein
MAIPAVRGIIERRMLINFRVEPAAVEKLVAAPFRLKLIKGKAMAGICLIRLRNIRPAFVPVPVGISSENAAHRIAIEWEANGRLRSGVYIPRRDSNSPFNSLLGGRLFPGVHHRADFEIAENEAALRVALVSRDKQTRVLVEGQPTDRLPSTSIFSSLAEASEFFRQGSLGYSPGYREGTLEGLELTSLEWKVEPLEVSKVESSFFSNLAQFPAGSVEFDCALLMRNVEHEWHQHPTIHLPVALKIAA